MPAQGISGFGRVPGRRRRSRPGSIPSFAGRFRLAWLSGLLRLAGILNFAFLTYPRCPQQRPIFLGDKSIRVENKRASQAVLEGLCGPRSQCKPKIGSQGQGSHARSVSIADFARASPLDGLRGLLGLAGIPDFRFRIQPLTRVPYAELGRVLVWVSRRHRSAPDRNPVPQPDRLDSGLGRPAMDGPPATDIYCRRLISFKNGRASQAVLEGRRDRNGTPSGSDRAAGLWLDGSLAVTRAPARVARSM